MSSISLAKISVAVASTALGSASFGQASSSDSRQEALKDGGAPSLVERSDSSPTSKIAIHSGLRVKIGPINIPLGGQPPTKASVNDEEPVGSAPNKIPVGADFGITLDPRSLKHFQNGELATWMLTTPPQMEGSLTLIDKPGQTQIRDITETLKSNGFKGAAIGRIPGTSDTVLLLVKEDNELLALPSDFFSKARLKVDTLEPSMLKLFLANIVSAQVRQAFNPEAHPDSTTSPSVAKPHVATPQNLKPITTTAVPIEPVAPHKGTPMLTHRDPSGSVVASIYTKLELIQQKLTELSGGFGVGFTLFPDENKGNLIAFITLNEPAFAINRQAGSVRDLDPDPNRAAEIAYLNLLKTVQKYNQNAPAGHTLTLGELKQRITPSGGNLVWTAQIAQ